ncbi:translocation/assembly module TamB domain-containing protein [Crocosphaera sp. XPORK-15E]|uniref:translocation/assembly module TamB domain-containing protein n=1 Tax=Crocosphaera sp. XPORK-15E TaxID=3110247 RepID=UPI002B214DC9|nr:translocation/assembly module TamB domain-containing protein [Crocosphaera sp. XPORK-15E]MEA5537312.1 translocation/assembly module TamB domain-containing protein [Crocosphaera sp. XPORK-15E]
MMKDLSHKKRDFDLSCPLKKQPQGKPRYRSLIGWGATVLVIGMGGGLVAGGLLIQRYLSPLVAQELSNFLNRPVKLGNLQSFSLNQVRFGETDILTTPTDPAKVSMSALAISYDPIKFFIEKKLEISVTVVSPNIYLEQGKEGNWILTEFDTLNPNNPIKLKALQIKNADAVLVSRSITGEKQASVQLKDLSSQTKFIKNNNNDQIQFEVDSHLVNGGNFKISGVADTQNQEVNLLLRSHQLTATEISRLIPLPLDLTQGKLDTNLEVKLRGNQLPRLQGVATLHQVTGQVANLPQPFQTQGQLLFKDRQIKFDDVVTQFGEVTGVVRGNIDLEKGYNLTAKTQATSIQSIFKTIKQTAPQLPLSGNLKASLTVQGDLNNPDLSIALSNDKTTKIDRVNLESINANLQLTKSHLIVKDFQAIPTLGGKIIGTGKLALSPYSPQFIVDIKGKNIPSASVANLYNKTVPLNLGQVSTQINLSGNLKQPKTFKAKGTANFKLAGGTINAYNLTYMGGNWQGNIIADAINLNQLEIPVNQGILTGQFQIAGQTNQPINESLKATGQAKIILDNGEINAQNLQLSQGVWQTNLGVHGVNLNKIVPKIPINGIFNGTFDLIGNLNSNLKEIQAKGEGILAVGGGEIKAKNLQLHQGNWSTQLSTKNVTLNNLSKQIPQYLNGKLNSNLALSGNINSPLDSLKGKGNANLALSQGAIAAQTVTIADGKFTTTLLAQAIPLTSFSSQLQGNLAGQITVSGLLTKISPEYLQAKGELSLSQGLSKFNSPLTTWVSWNGQRLTLEKVSASGLQGKGWLDLNLEGKSQQLAMIDGFFLDIAAKNFDLISLPLSSPLPGLNYGGKVDFDGVVAGTPKLPTINGEMALVNVNIGDIKFEPVLTGNIQGNPQKGIKLELNGKTDQLHLELDPKLNPLTLAVKQGKMQATATRQQEQFIIATKDIPLQLVQKFALNWQKTPNNLLSKTIAGDLSGQFTVNLKTGAIAGQEVAILNPMIGSIKGKQFTGNFHYAKGSLALKDGRFSSNNSQYDLNGKYTATPQGPDLVANIGINQGNLQDILETLQIFELTDLKRGLNQPNYAKAADLYPKHPENSSSLPPLSTVGTDNISLSDRLTHFADINAWLQQQRQQQQKTSPLPPLKDLQGKFNGQLALKFAPKTGLDGNFELKGENWQWGTYGLSQFQAKGNWKQGILTLEPLNLQLGDSQIAFAGRIGDKMQQGTLQVINIPLETVSTLVDLPETVNIGGQLNGSMKLEGTRDNPQAAGKLTINNPTINQTPLGATEGQFTYSRGQFNFTASSNLARQSEPLIMEGTFPYQFPLAKVKPESDRIFLKFQARNEALTLLNILSKGQISWLGGEGDVQLTLSGRVDPKRGIPTQLQGEGLAQIKNATIAAQMMPQAPLTKVQGKIFFNLDQIMVEGLTGQFSGGQVAIMGSLPLLTEIPQKQPLTVQFNNLALNLPQLYQGGVTGSLNIAGSALKPKIGGDVQLFNGQVLLGEGMAEMHQRGGLLGSTELTGLRLSLGEKILITRPPLLTFLATGGLTLNGTLNQPKPEGQIKLENGLVNLFASQLRLAGGDNNTAQFYPHKGLDPYLDIRLFAAATETNRHKGNIDPLSSEVEEPFSANNDSLQTVRIQAEVQGFASQITNGIQLSSQPKRSQQQIITLLGGNFLNTLGTGETTLGLANLAGSAVLGPVQGAIGEALGLSEFRIFPTPLINEKDRLNSSSIGVAAEAGVNVTQDLSLSIQKIMNSDRPAQFGLRYRINDSTTLRGSSNFSDDNRGSIQFEQRF